jgi:hypothetical protein
MGGLAEYAARQLKRGTASLLESGHFKDLLQNQGPVKLRKSYYGLKEWYLLARQQMETGRRDGSSADDIVRDAQSTGVCECAFIPLNFYYRIQ